MNKIKVTLLGSPYSTNSLYRHARGISYMSAKGKELKLSYIKQVREQYHGEPLSDLLNVEVHLYFGDDRVRDIDNYQKISMDALTDVVWVDDVQIMRLTIEKHKDKTNPRIELTITKYNGRKQT